MATCGCGRQRFNVIILGISFMLVFTAFQTCSIVEQTVLNGMHRDHSNFNGSGYYSLAIIYGVFAASNWIAPSVISVTGPRVALVAGGVVYSLFIASFIYPVEWLLYVGSCVLGVGAAIIWTAQGNFLTINSNEDTIGRNSGIFWALLQCSLVFGNLYVYFTFEGVTYIDDTTREELFFALLGVSCLGVIAMFFLKKRGNADQENLLSVPAPGESNPKGPLDALKLSFRLFKTREMLILSACFAYTGLELTYFSGVYGTCIGNTSAFGGNVKKYIGISGMLIGAGEILGGGIFGLAGKRTNKFGRDPIVLLGFLVHCLTFFLSFINLPQRSPIEPDLSPTYINPNLPLALLSSFLLGFGDSCYNTQIYSLLGFMFPEDSAPAFALFKFVQSTGAMVAFFYSGTLILKWQLLILVVMNFVGMMSFLNVELSCRRSTNTGYSRINVQENVGSKDRSCGEPQT